MRLAISLTASLLLCSCVSPVVKTFSDPNLTLQQIGILKAAQTSPRNVHFASYADLAGSGSLEFKKVGNTFSGFPGEIQLLPGRYLVMTYCSSGNSYGFPSVPLEVKAGMTHFIQCENVPGTGKLNASVASEEPTTTP